MTSQEELDRLLLMRLEFETPDTTDARRTEILTEMRDMAEGKSVRCRNCKHWMIHAPYTEALLEGHVYSDAGMAEIGITGICEFCFDKITLPEED